MSQSQRVATSAKRRLTPVRVFVGVAVLAVIASACSGDDGPGSSTEPPSGGSATVSIATPTTTPVPDGPPPTPSAPTPVPSSTPSSAAGIDALSLVYVDTSRGQGGDIYVAEANGANPRLVTNEAAYRRAMDVRGSTLAVVSGGGVTLIDLAGGEALALDEANIVFDGRFFDDGIFFYSLSGSCTQGGGSLKRVELQGVEVTELLTSRFSLTIAGVDAGSNTLALLPRACDVGVSSLDVYDALTGNLRNTLDVLGCGWAIAALQHNKAVASWQACTPPAEHSGAAATVYDFGIVGPTGHDVTAPDGGSNAAVWLLRPGAPEAALGTTTSVGSGPGSERGAGIYLLDLTDREFTKLADGEGAEQYPVAWSPDGRYLLYAIVEAQGLCRFAYVDAEAPGSRPGVIDPDITFCGVNGNVVGWTRLP